RRRSRRPLVALCRAQAQAQLRVQLALLRLQEHRRRQARHLVPQRKRKVQQP
ncbi:unnamed protein product, partial [Amoebophrya sp. A120]